MSRRAMTNLVAMVFVATMATSTPSAAASSERQDNRRNHGNLEMQVYSDAPGGVDVLAGAFDKAIRSASPNADRDGATGLVANTNLCVAYTKTRQFGRADRACNRALTLAREERVATAYDLNGRTAANRARAIALSNRGVLRTVQGDGAGASGDFRDALRLGVATAAPRRNLSYLENLMAGGVTLRDGV